MAAKKKAEEDFGLISFLKRRIRKLNKRSNRLTKKDINTLLDKDNSVLDYPETNFGLYKSANF